MIAGREGNRINLRYPGGGRLLSNNINIRQRDSAIGSFGPI